MKCLQLTHWMAYFVLGGPAKKTVGSSDLWNLFNSIYNLVFIFKNESITWKLTNFNKTGLYINFWKLCIFSFSLNILLHSDNYSWKPSHDLIFMPLGTKVPNSLIHSDSLTFKASLLLLKTFSIAAICMWLELCPETRIYCWLVVNHIKVGPSDQWLTGSS